MTEILTNAIDQPNAHEDQTAVTAVLSGDTERYRELVERHERRVFAVAWSRLGDATLAEEATQEAFIRAYRKLQWLGDGARFSSWVNTIVRRIAINFGLSRRRELDRRRQWALENAGEGTTETEPLFAPETLRQTLAQLPAGHRECLVLFYIEGKSGAEAAAALGLSEAVLRVRLHRARACLRERLEERLAGSLEQLRPSPGLSSAVMAGVLKPSAAKIAGGGLLGKLLAGLAKTKFFSGFFSLLSFIPMLPGVGVGWLLMRSERNNFREADGFRPRLHRKFAISFIWGFPLLMGAILLLGRLAAHYWGLNGEFCALACFCVIVTLISARTLVIGRNSFQVGMFIYTALIAVGMVCLAAGWLPMQMASLPILVSSIVFVAIMGKRPTRMDYNLFLRSSQGMLENPAPSTTAVTSLRLDQRELLAFGRFLGSRFLTDNFAWDDRGLSLRLPPVRRQFLSNMAFLFLTPFSGDPSRLTLGWEGTVEAHCGQSDWQSLLELKTAPGGSISDLETAVGETVHQAWAEFRAGQATSAEKSLGEKVANVFVMPPETARSTQWWRLYLIIAIIVMAGCMAFLMFKTF